MHEEFFEKTTPGLSSLAFCGDSLAESSPGLHGSVEVLVFVTGDGIALEPDGTGVAQVVQRLEEPADVERAPVEGLDQPIPVLPVGIRAVDGHQKEVRQGFVCYVRSKNKVKRIPFSDKDFKESIKIVNKTLDIIQHERFPKKTSFKLRCIDCCYKNICV